MIQEGILALYVEYSNIDKINGELFMDDNIFEVLNEYKEEILKLDRGHICQRRVNGRRRKV